jgi:hypothetical protein
VDCVSDRFLLALCEIRWATRGKWRILDGEVKSGLIFDSELQGGNPRLCRLRTNRLAPVNKIELCTDTYWLYGTLETK